MNENNELYNTNPFSLLEGDYHSAENVHRRAHGLATEFDEIDDSSNDKKSFISDEELALESAAREAFLKSNRDKKNVRIVAKVMCAAAAVGAVAAVLGVNLPAPTITLAICCAFGGGYLLNIKKPASEA